MCPLLSCPLFLFHLGSFVHCLLADLLGVLGPHSSDALSLQLKDSRVPWKTPLTQRLWGQQTYEPYLAPERRCLLLPGIFGRPVTLAFR